MKQPLPQKQPHKHSHYKSSKKPKIALLIEEPSVVGGIQSAAARHIRLLQKHFELIPVCFDKTRNQNDWHGRREKLPGFGGSGYQIFTADLKCDSRLNEGSLDYIRYDMRFRSMADHLIEIIKEEQVQMIHAFGQFHQRGVIAAFAAAKCAIPYMLSFRGVDLETRIFDDSLQQVHASLLGAKKVVCVSEDSAKLVTSLFRPNCEVHVIRNHFDPSQFVEERVDYPFLKGVQWPVLGCFGKFRRVMGVDFLLKAFETLNERQPTVLLMVGDLQKRESEYYNGLIEQTQFSERILRIANVPHKRILNYMKLCDVMVYPSISDASPNKVLEAMYAKVPIVSTLAGGIPELVRNKKDALLVPARSAKALAKACQQLIDDPTLAKPLVASAYQRVTNEFKSENEAPLWLDVYQQALRG